MAETNDKGEIALKYFQPTNKYVKVGGERNYREYMFVVGRAGISMAWIKPEDVAEILAMRGGCCGGNVALAFRYANEQDVRIWLGISER